MDINREVMETSLNVCEEVQEKDTKDNPPSTSQENFQIKQEVVIKEEAIDIPENEDYVSECEEEKKRVCPYFVTDGLTFEKELFDENGGADKVPTSTGKQNVKEMMFSKLKLPAFSSQVMPYLNGEDLGDTQRKAIFNLLVKEIIYYLDKECLLMSSNSNEQGIGYSQLQRKLLETYPKMLKEPHNILRKHKSKGPLSVLTTAISDRRRKRRERLRRSQCNFNLCRNP